MSTTNTAPKDDEISRRIFYGGMFALPWLWIVHTLGWYSKQKVERDDEDDNLNLEASNVKLNEEMWVKRCRDAAIAVTSVWIVWVLLAQVFLTDKLPAFLFVRTPDQSEYTGW